MAKEAKIKRYEHWNDLQWYTFYSKLKPLLLPPHNMNQKQAAAHFGVPIGRIRKTMTMFNFVSASKCVHWTPEQYEEAAKEIDRLSKAPHYLSYPKIAKLKGWSRNRIAKLAQRKHLKSATENKKNDLNNIDWAGVKLDSENPLVPLTTTQLHEKWAPFVGITKFARALHGRGLHSVFNRFFSSPEDKGYIYAKAGTPFSEDEINQVKALMAGNRSFRDAGIILLRPRQDVINICEQLGIKASKARHQEVLDLLDWCHIAEVAESLKSVKGAWLETRTLIPQVPYDRFLKECSARGISPAAREHKKRDIAWPGMSKLDQLMRPTK